jgi:hypothetical protein
MNMRKKIKVEQRHIDDAERISVTKCPLALAVRESTGREDLAVTGSNICSYQAMTKLPDGVYGPPERGSGDNMTILLLAKDSKRLTQRASKFVNDFDARRPVKPTTFILEIPSVDVR